MNGRVAGIIATVAALLVFTPLATWAGICFSISGLPSPATVDIDVFGPGLIGGKTYLVGGQFGNWCGAGTPPAATSGLLWFNPDHSISFGARISVARNGCAAGTFEGTFAPDLQSGHGTAFGSSLTTLTLTRSACSPWSDD